MINYKKGKERFKPNELGSLYIDYNTLDENERPIIYIGGQMEHRFHIVEQTGFTSDPGHNMFNGSWFYDYSIFSNNKSSINAHNMAKNLLEALKMAELKDVDVVTESFGGLIASYASISTYIHKVYAIHPPITGTPLANPILLQKYNELFNKQEKLINLILKRIINYNYGFEQDNYKGANLTKIDLNKILVIGSSIDLEKEKNNLAKNLYDMILKATGKPSDGIVLFDPKQLEEKGINYLVEEKGLNHFDAGSKNNLKLVKEYVINNKQ